MKNTFLAVIIFFSTSSAFACECHDTGYSAGFRGFGTFSSWQLPAQDCDPSHVALNKGEVIYEDQKTEVKEKLEESSENVSDTVKDFPS